MAKRDDSRPRRLPKPADRTAQPRPKPSVDKTSKKDTKPIPDERVVKGVSMLHERLIGRVIVAWSKVEFKMHDAIWCFLDMYQGDGRLLTGNNDAGDNIKILRSIRDHKFPKAGKAAFTELIRELVKCQEDRNFIAHAVWGSLMPSRTPLASSMRRSGEGLTTMEFVSEQFDTERMQSIIERMDGCLAELNYVMERLEAARATKGEQHPPP